MANAGTQRLHFNEHGVEVAIGGVSVVAVPADDATTDSSVVGNDPAAGVAVPFAFTDGLALATTELSVVGNVGGGEADT